MRRVELVDFGHLPRKLCRSYLIGTGDLVGRYRGVYESGLGALSEMQNSCTAYSISKTALNAVTRQLAAALADQKIVVNSVCPGWVATEMGGRGAPRSAEEGAVSVLWGVLLPDDGPTGGFYRDGRPLRW